MKVVCNASPLVNLSRIGKLDLLKGLYGKILIPAAVYNEVVIEGQGLPGASEISRADWIISRNIKNHQQVKILRFDLDPGEAECIVLALEENSNLLIMDERIGREMARHLNVIYTGTIGALIEAKKKGLIGPIQPILEDLRDKAGFRVSGSLFKYVLEVAGESSEDR